MLVNLFFLINQRYDFTQTGSFFLSARDSDHLVFDYKESFQTFIFTSCNMNSCIEVGGHENSKQFSDYDLKGISFDQKSFQIKFLSDANVSIWILPPKMCHLTSLFVMSKSDFTVKIRPKKNFASDFMISKLFHFFKKSIVFHSNDFLNDNLQNNRNFNTNNLNTNNANTNNSNANNANTNNVNTNNANANNVNTNNLNTNNLNTNNLNTNNANANNVNINNENTNNVNTNNINTNNVNANIMNERRDQYFEISPKVGNGINSSYLENDDEFNFCVFCPSLLKDSERMVSFGFSSRGEATSSLFYTNVNSPDYSAFNQYSTYQIDQPYFVKSTYKKSDTHSQYLNINSSFTNKIVDSSFSSKLTGTVLYFKENGNEFTLIDDDSWIAGLEVIYSVSFWSRMFWIWVMAILVIFIMAILLVLFCVCRKLHNGIDREENGENRDDDDCCAPDAAYIGEDAEMDDFFDDEKKPDTAVFIQESYSKEEDDDDEIESDTEDNPYKHHDVVFEHFFPNSTTATNCTGNNDDINPNSSNIENDNCENPNSENVNGVDDIRDERAKDEKEAGEDDAENPLEVVNPYSLPI
ncbi:hypothetical protein TRFO_28967 [Tritrichomonas foetus]|uniref:Uncharacterized protein n=1 Tax=Tritrichomonas foetus TaxID=1144522 RepID=A0A1J4JWS5_9EUKA|nr:hypothetical protein TRFO_28967 [Tritrichomonas foetus]|eukprot:OHT03599.1 hypothetical protein TRFO_28967 [Tritrichomonas foetus]